MRIIKSRYIFKRKHLIFIFILTFLFQGCLRSIPPLMVNQVQIQKSEEQSIVLINTHGSDIEIEPTDNGGNAIRLGQNDQIKIKFFVLSVGDINSSDIYDWYVLEGNYINYIEESGPIKFLKTAGLDLELNIRNADGTLEQLSLSIQNCPNPAWYEIVAPTAEHPIGSKSLPGVKTKICPKISP